MKNIWGKSLLLLALSVFVILNLFVSSASASYPFKDISSADKEIIYLWNEGLINGTSSTTFSPTAAVTREQAATLIGRALDLNGAKRSTVFPDVSPGRYSSGYIQSAVEQGILTGYPDGTFRPQETMTRGEMAYLMSRAFKLTATGPVYFQDVTLSTQSGSLYQAVNKIATAGITNGTGSGNYPPNKDLIRREFAIFLARALEPSFKVVFQNAQIAELAATTDNLNIRSGPSTNYSAVGQIDFGDKVTVYDYHGDWVYGKTSTKTGYIHGAYLGTPSTTERYIAIDPGHGGDDPGAVANGLQEKEVNLDVAKRVKTLLNDKGIKVYMTRTTDVFITLGGRVTNSVNSGADAFVSIHANAYTPSTSGSETFYSAASEQTALESKQLATFIQNRLYRAMDHNNRGVKEYGYYVLRTNPLPAALTELGFLTNSSDASKLSTSWYRDQAASAIAEGIEDFYDWKEQN